MSSFVAAADNIPKAGGLNMQGQLHDTPVLSSET